MITFKTLKLISIFLCLIAIVLVKPFKGPLVIYGLALGGVGFVGLLVFSYLENK